MTWNGLGFFVEEILNIVVFLKDDTVEFVFEALIVEDLIFLISFGSIVENAFLRTRDDLGEIMGY